MTMRDIMMVEIYGVNFAIIDVVKEMELAEHPGADFILEIGSHVKIKRVLFERFLDAASCV